MTFLKLFFSKKDKKKQFNKIFVGEHRGFHSDGFEGTLGSFLVMIEAYIGWSYSINKHYRDSPLSNNLL